MGSLDVTFTLSSWASVNFLMLHACATYSKLKRIHSRTILKPAGVSLDVCRYWAAQDLIGSVAYAEGSVGTYTEVGMVGKWKI
jgi:hypothetical protein